LPNIHAATFQETTLRFTGGPASLLRYIKEDNDNSLMVLLAPACEDGTLSVIHNIKVVDGKAVGIYGTKLSASLREINLIDMTTPLKTNDKNYIPNLSDFETTITTNVLRADSKEIEANELTKRPSFILIHPRLFTNIFNRRRIHPQTALVEIFGFANRHNKPLQLFLPLLQFLWAAIQGLVTETALTTPEESIGVDNVMAIAATRFVAAERRSLGVTPPDEQELPTPTTKTKKTKK